MSLLAGSHQLELASKKCSLCCFLNQNFWFKTDLVLELVLSMFWFKSLKLQYWASLKRRLLKAGFYLGEWSYRSLFNGTWPLTLWLTSNFKIFHSISRELKVEWWKLSSNVAFQISANITMQTPLTSFLFVAFTFEHSNSKIQTSEFKHSNLGQKFLMQLFWNFEFRSLNSNFWIWKLCVYYQLLKEDGLWSVAWCY